MKLSRRNFIRLSAVTTAGMPLLHFSCSPDRKKSSVSGESLYDLFKNPPNNARPFVRWWWNGNRLNKREILRELDLLKAAGIGGVEINSIKFPEHADPMDYRACDWLSDEWLGMLQTALEGARQRGIVCDIIVGSGWPFGGEFLDRGEQSQMLALGTRGLKGPARYEVSRQELIDDVEPYIHSAYDKKQKELALLRLAPAAMDVFSPGEDLNAELQKEIITIAVPEGDHQLYYLVKQTGYMAVINGAPGAKGPVLNHYNQAAVQKYLDRMSSALTEKIGRPGGHFRAFFTDSLELEGANWCDDMPEQFRQRRGYSLLPYLPFILFKVGHMGNALEEEYGTEFSEEMQELLQQVRYDFEVTRAELFRERFLNTFQAWCEKNGVQSRVQAYGRGYYPLESSMLIDIPECETWLGPSIGGPMPENNYGEGRAYSMINKFVSSGARLAGKKLVSCEEITNTGMVFNASLEKIKIAGDQSNLSGVTHSILHGFNYSPPDAPFPGWVRYGTFFNERNTWWPYFKAWTAYKARLSALFQHAELYSDVAVMHPLADMWMKFGSQRDPFPTKVYPPYAHNVWEAIHQNGNSCDYISEGILQQSEFENGEISYGTRRYKTLLLLEAEALQTGTVQALKRYAAAGGRIIFVGKEPIRSAGFSGHKKNDPAVKAVIQELKRDHPGKVILFPSPDGPILEWYRKLQAQAGIEPDLKFEKPVSHISQVAYRTAEAAIFFITNSSLEKAHRTKAFFTIENKNPWLWDPETGQRFIYPHKENELLIELEPAGSKLIVFTSSGEGETYSPVNRDAASRREIAGPWELTLQHVNGETSVRELAALTDFREDEQLKTFAGAAVYRKNINVEKPDEVDRLDLGTVQGVSEVSVNGQSLGFKWYGNHIYDLKKTLKPGANMLEVKITTVLGNYAKSLKSNPVAQEWTANQPFYACGLIGPVELLASFDLS